MKNIILFALFLISININAQQLQLLKEIGAGNNFVGEGVGVGFNGEILSDGQLYFLGAQNSSGKSYWSTDGTGANTDKLVDEPGFSSWQSTRFLKNGIITDEIKNGRFIYYYDISTKERTAIAENSGKSLVHIAEMMGDEHVMVLRVEDNLEFWQTDLTSEGTSRIGTAGENDLSLTLTASQYGAALVNPSSLSDHVSMFYDPVDGQSKELLPYLQNIRPTLTSLRHAYIVDKFMIIQAGDEGIIRNYLLDMENNVINTFQFTRQPIEHFYHEGELVIITESDVIKLNPETYEYTVLFDGVLPTSPVARKDNLLYVVGSGFYSSFEIHQIDLDSDTEILLPDTEVGFGFINAKIALYEDKMYFLSKSGQTTTMYEYDLENQERIFIDEVIASSGGISFAPALVTVGDRLLVSRYTLEEGHELYWLDKSVASQDINISNYDMNVYPNPAIDVINVDTDASLDRHEIRIFDLTGRLVLNQEITSPKVNVATLNTGQYTGILISNKGKSSSFVFTKL